MATKYPPTKYVTTTGLRIDLRKMHGDDSVSLRCDYPDPTTQECMEKVDELVIFYHKRGKLIVKVGQ